MAFPNSLKPKKLFLLKRIGRNNDGGYLIDVNSINNTSTLISFGISDDWSFENHFLKLNKNLKVFCYDKNLSLYFLIKLFFKKIIFFLRYSLKDIYYSFIQIFKFILFFRQNSLVKDKISYNFLTRLIKNKFFTDPIFLKVDIEEWEYRILEDITKISNRLSGLVIEFHNVDLHLNKIVDFVKKVNLELVHIHANNGGIPKVDLNGNPTVIELTFAKNPIISSTDFFTPNSLDQKNKQELEDILINFE